MKYFEYIDNLDDIFYLSPCEYNITSSKEKLAYSIGALLYMSALREDLLNCIVNLKSKNCNSVCICLEDATDSRQLINAEKNVFRLLKELDKLHQQDEEFIERNLPLIFIRVKHVEQLKRILFNYPLSCLAGFIIPKINQKNCADYMSPIYDYNKKNNRNIYILPVLESTEIAHKETRIAELLGLKKTFDKYKDNILNIRIGATDLSGILGIRRSRQYTIYEVGSVSDCIFDIINVFKRDDYVISGPVFEYFTKSKVHQYDTFSKEIHQDIVNGLMGKTVIHPNQIPTVNASLVVSKEDYIDAMDILKCDEDGVIKSYYGNKMNEIKPHTKWAIDIIKRAEVMGVYNDGKGYKDLLKSYTRYYSEASLRNKIESK